MLQGVDKRCDGPAAVNSATTAGKLVSQRVCEQGGTEQGSSSGREKGETDLHMPAARIICAGGLVPSYCKQSKEGGEKDQEGY